MSNGLIVDLYQLTVAQALWQKQKNTEAVFELSYRRNPYQGGYCLFAGLDTFLDDLSEFYFTLEDIDYLYGLKIFSEDFLEFLKQFSFQADIFSAPEGSLIFPYEPYLYVKGNIVHAQLIESFLLNQLNFQTLIATKAARIKGVCDPERFMEMGLRRAYGIDSALQVSRAAHIGGASATSYAKAGKKWNIPVMGTMSHSWVMCFPSEQEAFRQFAQIYPHKCVFVLDTYDSLNSGLPHAIQVFQQMGKPGPNDYWGVRIDSGYIAYLSKNIRQQLDQNGLDYVHIIASNDLDEYKIADLKDQNAKVDAWGIGTQLAIGGQGHSLGGIYKLAHIASEQAQQDCMKISDDLEKTTLPGEKQVYRFYDERYFLGDLIIDKTQENEYQKQIQEKQMMKVYHLYKSFSHKKLTQYQGAYPLCQLVYTQGKKIQKKTLAEIRDYALLQLSQLEWSTQRINNVYPYKVSISKQLKNKRDHFLWQYKTKE